MSHSSQHQSDKPCWRCERAVSPGTTIDASCRSPGCKRALSKLSPVLCKKRAATAAFQPLTEQPANPSK